MNGSRVGSVDRPPKGVIMWILFDTCPNSAIQIPKNLSSSDQLAQGNETANDLWWLVRDLPSPASVLTSTIIDLLN